MRHKILTAVCVAAALMAVGCAGKTAGTQAQPEAPQAAETAAAANDEAAPEETTAQSTQTQEEAAAQDDAAASIQTYEGADGWTADYDSSLFEVKEGSGVSFVYKPEAAGTNQVDIMYYTDMMPDEALYEAMAGAEGLPEHTRSEAPFLGMDDVWSLQTSVAAQDGEAGTNDYIAVEHNSGTLVLTVTASEQADEGAGIAVSDALASVVDSVKLINHEPQTYADYVPGKYVQTVTEEIEGEETTAEYFVQLNEDHSGVIHLQDEIPVIWYCRDGVILDASTGKQIYEYTVEGDSLMLWDSNDENAETLTFEKENA